MTKPLYNEGRDLKGNLKRPLKTVASLNFSERVKLWQNRKMYEKGRDQ